VVVAAGNDFHHVALAAGAGFGAVAFAPGVDVTVLANHTGATIGAGASVTAKGDVRVDAHASEDLLMIGMGIAAGTVGVGGGVSVLSLSNQTYASIAGTVSAGGDVSVTSTDKTSVLMISAASRRLRRCRRVGGVLVIGKDTQAFIADNASVSAKGTSGGTGGVLDGTLDGATMPAASTPRPATAWSCRLSPAEDHAHSVAAGGGFVGVSGAIDVSVIGSDTLAWIGDADINQAPGNPGAAASQGVYVARPTMPASPLSPARCPADLSRGRRDQRRVLKEQRQRENRHPDHVGDARVTARGDVQVNALGIKKINSYTLSGAGVSSVRPRGLGIDSSRRFSLVDEKGRGRSGWDCH